MRGNFATKMNESGVRYGTDNADKPGILCVAANFLRIRNKSFAASYFSAHAESDSTRKRQNLGAVYLMGGLVMGPGLSI
jgi:hypothetical protein